MNPMENKYAGRSLENIRFLWIDKEVVSAYLPSIGPTAFTVYAVLAYYADSKQKCFPSQWRIAERAGFSRSTVCRALKTLEGYSLIEKRMKPGGKNCEYLLLQVGGCSAGATDLFHRRKRYVSPAGTNDNKLKIINIDIGRKNKVVLNSSLKGFIPETREEALALDLARALNDEKGLPFYLSFSKKYPESFLRGILSQVKEIPESKIKKSRAALFNYLVQKEARQRRGA